MMVVMQCLRWHSIRLWCEMMMHLLLSLLMHGILQFVIRQHVDPFYPLLPL
jgi:uncharacterized membrane protein YagU involved in acid resistance